MRPFILQDLVSRYGGAFQYFRDRSSLGQARYAHKLHDKTSEVVARPVDQPPQQRVPECSGTQADNMLDGSALSQAHAYDLQLAALLAARGGIMPFGALRTVLPIPKVRAEKYNPS